MTIESDFRFAEFHCGGERKPVAAKERKELESRRLPLCAPCVLSWQSMAVSSVSSGLARFRSVCEGGEGPVPSSCLLCRAFQPGSNTVFPGLTDLNRD